MHSYWVSIHAPRVGSDLILHRGRCHTVVLFQSTLPAWGATVPNCTRIFSSSQRFQSTLPAWGATHASRAALALVSDPVSIHAPRVGSDQLTPDSLIGPSLGFNPRSPRGERRYCEEWAPLSVSIHAPRVGSDGRCKATCALFDVFQSTLPAWGATTKSVPTRIWRSGFNPRSPRGERQATIRRV